MQVWAGRAALIQLTSAELFQLFQPAEKQIKSIYLSV